MTGMWPGDKRNPGMKKKSLVSSLEAVKTEEIIIIIDRKPNNFFLNL
jgi:hypothetical protein